MDHILISGERAYATQWLWAMLYKPPRQMYLVEELWQTTGPLEEATPLFLPQETPYDTGEDETLRWGRCHYATREGWKAIT